MVSGCYGSLRADLNGDSRVDFIDFSILASEWMYEEPMADSYLKFNGTDQYVTVATNASLNFGTDDLSFCFLLDPITPKTLFSMRQALTSNFEIRVEGNSVLTMDFGWSGNQFVVAAAKPIGRTFIVVVKTSAGLQFYYNGVAQSMTQLVKTGTPSAPLNADMFMGCKYNTTNFSSVGMDDIRFYKKALSQAEVTAIYNGGRGTKLTGSEDGLSWGSNCDDATGYTLTDITGTVNGTLTGNVADNMWVAGGVNGITDLLSLGISNEYDEQWVW